MELKLKNLFLKLNIFHYLLLKDILNLFVLCQVKMNNELKQLNYESFKEILISILKNNNNNIYFYQEDLDLKTNLFLYQNNINPNIYRLIYNK